MTKSSVQPLLERCHRKFLLSLSSSLRQESLDILSLVFWGSRTSRKTNCLQYTVKINVFEVVWLLENSSADFVCITSKTPLYCILTNSSLVNTDLNRANCSVPRFVNQTDISSNRFARLASFSCYFRSWRCFVRESCDKQRRCHGWTSRWWFKAWHV